MSYAAAPPYPPRTFELNPPVVPYAAAAADPAAFSQPYYIHRDAHTPPPSLEIHTLFVSGLPDDVKAREIHNLFRRRPGFDSCQLKYTGRGDQVVAFATFVNHHSAMAALEMLNGATFDLLTGASLHIELAKSNSRKRPRGAGAYAIIDKRVKVRNDDQENSINDVECLGDDGSDEPSGIEDNHTTNEGASIAAPSGESAVEKENVQGVSNDQLEKPAPGDIPPCSTLFIANLGPNCTVEELKQVLSKYAGFQTLKMRGRGAMPVAFADFVDVECSTLAMNELQDKLLGSSDRGGMHLEYARSKMKKGQINAGP